MPYISIDVTNVCNRNCFHCLRDKLEPRKHLPVSLFSKILDQSYSCGIRYISLTGGEPTLHPEWDKFPITLAEKQLKFSVITNGHKFREKMLPLLLEPTVKRFLEYLCLSLDGASPNSHDTLRGENSFQEVIEAANLCQLAGIPLALKTVVTNLNKGELMEIGVLGATLRAKQHSFLALIPTPRGIEKEIVPSPEEMKEIHSFITGRLSPVIKTEIVLEGSWGIDGDFFCCNAFQQAYSIDHLGNLLFCCNLSHITNGNRPATLGKEFLADLKRRSLKEGIIQHYQMLAQFTEARLNNALSESLLNSFSCWWCLGHFNKREWIENYTNSPWVKEILPQKIPV